MSSDRDISGRLGAWLMEDAHEDAWTVVDRVLEQLDSTPQRRSRWWPPEGVAMTPSARLGLVAAGVAATLIGIGLLSGRYVATPPEAPASTPMVRSFVAQSRGAVEPGQYVVDAAFPVELTFSVPDGWDKLSADEGSVMLTKGGPPDPWTASAQFWIVDEVYIDPCRRDLGTQDPGDSVDDLVAVLTTQPGVAATAPTDTTLGGLPATYFESQSTLDVTDCLGDQAAWFSAPGEFDAIAYPEHQDLRNRYWVLDVDGVRLLVSASDRASTSQEDRRQVDEILASVRFTAPDPP